MFCVEPQSIPVLLGHSSLRVVVPKYEIASAFLVDRLRIGKHPQFSTSVVRDACAVLHRRPLAFALALSVLSLTLATFVGRLIRIGSADEAVLLASVREHTNG